MIEPFSKITSHRDVVYGRFSPSEFVGRDWLMRELVRFKDSPDKRHLIIIGEPGSGKSAFLAYLADSWNCPRHFIRVGNFDGVSGVDPRQFFISIGLQLRQKYGDAIFALSEREITRLTVKLAEDKARIVGRVVEELFTLPFIPMAEKTIVVDIDTARGESEIVGERINRIVNVAQALDATTLLHVAILQPAQRLYEQYPDEKLIICIDALDESLHHTGEQILDFIPSVDDSDLSPNLQFVMTSRRGSHLNRFRNQDRLYLDDDERGYWQEQVRDTEKYITRQLEAESLNTIVSSWSKGKKQKFMTEVRDKSEGNFLYLRHFFIDMKMSVATGIFEYGPSKVPVGLDAIYEQFALARIRKQVHDSIYFPLLTTISEEMLNAWRNIEGIQGLSATSDGVTLVALNSDKVIVKLLHVAWQNNVTIDEEKLITRKGSGLGNWEEKYLPVLGILAVAFDYLSRDQLTAFTGVEPAFVDSILYQLQPFLDVVPSTPQKYAFYHRSFAEYLLDKTRNQVYPLDGKVYHTQISDYYIGRMDNQFEIDWSQINDNYVFRYLVQHLTAGYHSNKAFYLLKNFSWMQAKLTSTSANDLIADYEQIKAESTDIDLLFKILQASVHILLNDQTQLWYQLVGRGGQPKDFLPIQRMPLHPPGSRLVPAISNFAAPDPCLLRMYSVHDGPVRVITFLPHSQAIVAATDNAIFILDLLSGTQQVLPGAIYDTRTIAVSPDGNVIALGGGLALGRSFDNRIKLWALETREKLQDLTGHEEPIGQLVYTPDGTSIVSASWDQTIRLWDLQTGKTIQAFEGHTEGLNAVALIPERNLIVSGASDSTVRVWSIETATLVCTLLGHENFVLSVAVFSDGRRIVSGSSDKTVRIWDIDAREEMLCLNGHTGAVLLVSVLNDQQRIVSVATDGTIRIWDSLTGIQLTCVYNDLRFFAAAIAPNGTDVVTSSSGLIKYWNISNYPTDKTASFIGHRGRITGLHYIEAQEVIVTGALDSTVKVWSFRSGKEKETITINEAVLAIGVLASTSSVLVLCPKSTKLWDVGTGNLKTVNTCNLGSEYDDLFITATGYVITTYTDVWTSLEVFNPSTSEKYGVVFGGPRELDAFILNTQAMEHKGKNDYYCIVKATPDGKYVLVYVNSDAGVFVLDITSGEVVAKISDSELWYFRIHALDFTADHRCLMVQRGNIIELWTLQSWAYVKTLDVLEVASVITTTHDGTRLICGYSDGLVRIWDAVTGSLQHTVAAHNARIYRLLVSDDDRLLYTFSKDANLRVWSVDTPRLLGSIYFDTLVEHAVVSAIGNDILVGEASGRIHVLHLSSE